MANRDLPDTTGVAAIAAAAGVATGVLIAPESGKETGKDMNNKVLSFNDAVQRRTEKLKKSAAFAAQKVGNVVMLVHEKTADVGKDIKDGTQVITQDVRNTSGHIVNEFDNL